ncbi:transport protein particle component [Lindgomyces ingoldianus]|uniref:Transport protein particle component n=1 Tax=Lindgomyces ingoldianus TaxID=673940 RepID=A0ACB6R4F8_9PLEO|nr:transport protein particle component [Lindgomyces ingoldianus]KAF2474061.1 transport protein particle component [Lindgomyces ingoldianus]
MANPSTPTDPSLNTPYNDPTATLLSTSCLDFLLIELVPMAYRITSDLAAREEEWMRGSSSLNPRSDDSGSTAGNVGRIGDVGGVGGAVGGTVDEEEAREAVFHRLETLGYRVGLGVVERFSRDKPRPTTPLDIIKFLCKDLWTLLFRKQIDNLKTNHRGIYVLTDNSFKPLSRMSFDTKKFDQLPAQAAAAMGDTVAGLGKDANYIARVQPFLYFPAGVIRGSLAALGIQATVQAESSGPPNATFQIRTVGAKP